MISNRYVIRERSNIIPIKQKLFTSMKSNSFEEYSLKQNFFDPSKSSPPNEFMLKLHIRLNNFYLDKKDDSLDIE